MPYKLESTYSVQTISKHVKWLFKGEEGVAV